MPTVSYRELVGKVPTSKIEAVFKQLALGLGVDVRCGVFVQDSGALQAQFPAARYFVGADGKRSVVRRERFGDSLCADYGTHNGVASAHVAITLRVM